MASSIFGRWLPKSRSRSLPIPRVIPRVQGKTRGYHFALRVKRESKDKGKAPKSMARERATRRRTLNLLRLLLRWRNKKGGRIDLMRRGEPRRREGGACVCGYVKALACARTGIEYPERRLGGSRLEGWECLRKWRGGGVGSKDTRRSERGEGRKEGRKEGRGGSFTLRNPVQAETANPTASRPLSYTV